MTRQKRSDRVDGREHGGDMKKRKPLKHSDREPTKDRHIHARIPESLYQKLKDLDIHISHEIRVALVQAVKSELDKRSA